MRPDALLSAATRGLLPERRRYLVTGCAGFVGSHLTKELLDRGYGVLGVDAFTDYYARPLKEANLASLGEREGFDLVEADLAATDLVALLDGVDGVYHLAAQPGVRGSWGETFALYVERNLVATQRLFEAAASSSVRVVFASSSSIYGDAEGYPTRETASPLPVSPYGVTKLACERLADAYRLTFDLDVVALRYFTVYGPRQRPDMAFSRLIGALLDGTPFVVFGNGSQSRDFTFVGDAVAATIAAMDAGSPAPLYNVGGGAEATLRDAIALCEELGGRTLDVRYAETAAGDVRRTAADTSLIRDDVGWEPTVSLERGLAAQIEAAQLARGSGGHGDDAAVSSVSGQGTGGMGNVAR